MRRSRRNGWTPARVARCSLAVLTLAGALAFAETAGAADVTFPKTRPKLQLTVPDGWSVVYTDVGLELRSPQKDSVIVAKIIKRDRSTVDAWSKKVLTVMKSDGISVDAAAAAAKPAAPGASTGSSTEVGAAPAGAPEPEMPGNAVVPSFAYAGAPNVGTPSLGDGAAGPQARASVPAGAVPGDPARGPAPAGGKRSATINGLHFEGYRLLGGRFNGKPTDMELVLFALPQDEFFAIEQQSAPDDNRAAAILSSVKPLRG